MSIESSSRRGFLKVLAQGSAVTGAVCLGIGCSGGGAPSAPIDAGNVKDLPVGTIRAISGESMAIARDDQGIYAMSLICTHAGCDMESQGSISAQEIVCNCHGSVFSPNGDPRSGPASSPLEHYAVTVDFSGQITIGTTTVPETDRTPAA